MERESFVFYKSFAEAIEILEPEEYAEAVRAIIRYGIYGELPDIANMSSSAFMVFTLTKPQIDANNKRFENGKKGADYGKLGGRPKHKNPIGVIDENPIGVKAKTPNVNVNVNDNENIKEKDKKKSATSRAPSKPTIEEIAAYCRERGNSVDPQAFYDFYESKGWMIGKNHMKDWKAAVRTWERKEGRGKKTGFDKFKQNEYDFEALEQELIAN